MPDPQPDVMLYENISNQKISQKMTLRNICCGHGWMFLVHICHNLYVLCRIYAAHHVSKLFRRLQRPHSGSTLRNVLESMSFLMDLDSSLCHIEPQGFHRLLLSKFMFFLFYCTLAKCWCKPECHSLERNVANICTLSGTGRHKNQPLPGNVSKSLRRLWLSGPTWISSSLHCICQAWWCIKWVLILAYFMSLKCLILFLPCSFLWLQAHKKYKCHSTNRPLAKCPLFSVLNISLILFAS